MYAVSRPTGELIGLFERAKTLEKKQDKSRNAIFNNALLNVTNFSDEEWLNISETKVNFNFDAKSLPTSLKVEIYDENSYKMSLDRCKRALNLSRLKISYFMKLCLKAYVCKLESENYKNNKSDMILKGNPIIAQIDKWIKYSLNEPQCPYKGNEMIHDIYRALNDTDCKLTGGNLLADTIFSAWYPLKMVLECLNDKKFYKQDKYGCDPHHYLKEIQSNIDKLLPKEKKVVQKLYEFFSIANTRGNVMILPNRQMQSRGINYLDQMPKTLYECFEGGKFSKYFGKDFTVKDWVVREHLELFFDGEIKKDRIKPILESESIKPNEFYWLEDESAIISMLENCILVIQKRNAIYKSI